MVSMSLLVETVRALTLEENATESLTAGIILMRLAVVSLS